MIKVIYDLETTGRDENKNSIWQIAMAFEINGQVVDFLDIKMKPFQGADIDAEALAVGNVTVEDLNKFISQSDGFHILESKLKKYIPKGEKAILVGYNSLKFDDGFFWNFFIQNGSHLMNYFHPKSQDVLAMCTVYFEDCMPKNLKQSTVARALDIEVKDEELHNAAYDIMLTYKIYKILYGNFRKS